MSSFGSAFKTARAAGRKTFAWQGKSYTTETKDEADKKALANHPAPPARPKDEAPAKKADAAKPAVDQANAVTAKSVKDDNDEVAKAKAKHAEAVKRLAR